MERRAWRVMDSGAGSAAWNMALDEALLTLAGRGDAPPALRFFSWEEPSLSIGSFQKTDELDMERVMREQVPFVRRPTGGRAVLHGAELTYSVACPIPSPYFPSDLMGSYKTIGACFLRGLGLLGVDAALVPVSKNPDRKKAGPMRGGNPLCFSSPSWYEVLLGGKKLIGSAQRRLKDSFLQQGSLLIGLDIPGLLSFMTFPDDAARDSAHRALSGKMTALNAHLSSNINIRDLKAALIKGFAGELGAEFVESGPTEEEMELAVKLLHEKYATEKWNLFRSAT